MLEFELDGWDAFADVNASMCSGICAFDGIRVRQVRRI